MTVATISNTTWNFTCKVCTKIRNAFVALGKSIMTLGEIAGTSRAAAELHRQGYTKEAKALMLELKNLRKEA